MDQKKKNYMEREEHVPLLILTPNVAAPLLLIIASKNYIPSSGSISYTLKLGI